MTVERAVVETLMVSAERLPVVVVPLKRGADVRYRVDDPSWFAPGALREVRVLPAVRVTVADDGTYDRVPRLHEISHTGGRPTYGGFAEAGVGIEEPSYDVQVGPGLDGLAQGWTFGTQQLTTFVDEALGASWSHRTAPKPLWWKVAMVVAILCAAVAVIGLLISFVLPLL